jgi:hypothetical protein
MKWYGRSVALALALATGGTARAGIFTDDMTRCILRSTTDQDRVLLARWIFGSLAANPAIRDLSSVTPDQTDKMDRDFARIFQRLVLVDCRKETVIALKNEGMSALESSFETLGSSTMTHLVSGKEVDDRARSFSKYLDEQKLEALGKEAGVSTKPRSEAEPSK